MNRQPAEGDLLGKDLADAVWHVLSRGERSAHGFTRVAELLVRRGRLSGPPAALAPTIAAAVRADIAKAEIDHSRPRFRVRGGRVALSEWLLPKPLVRSEQEFVNASERYAHELRRALIQKLSELPTAGFAELIATWLNGEGVIALRAVRRPGSTGNELHFAGTRKSGSEELRIAIVVLRGGRDIDRESVIDVRGALHHYGQAGAAWIVTTGRTTSGARDEAAAAGASACALFDGMGLATAMERLGIALRRYTVPHFELDYDLLESLGDTPEQRERKEREDAREQRFARERSADTNRRAPDADNSRSPGAVARDSRGESSPPEPSLPPPPFDRDESARKSIVAWDEPTDDEPVIEGVESEAADEPEGDFETDEADEALELEEGAEGDLDDSADEADADDESDEDESDESDDDESEADADESESESEEGDDDESEADADEDESDEADADADEDESDEDESDESDDEDGDEDEDGDDDAEDEGSEEAEPEPEPKAPPERKGRGR
jgi:Restriction endonuclease